MPYEYSSHKMLSAYLNNIRGRSNAGYLLYRHLLETYFTYRILVYYHIYFNVCVTTHNTIRRSFSP